MFIKAPSSQRERARDGNARKLLSRFCCSPAEACRRSGEDEVLKMRKIYMVIFARETLAHCVVRQKASFTQRDCVSSCFAAPVWSTRWKKKASKTAKHGGASRASVARAVRQPFTAEAHAQLRDAIIAVQTDWSDAHGRVSKAALCEADEDAVENAQKACHTLREEGGMGWMARVRVVKRGNRHWEEDSAVLHHQLVGMVCDGS